LLCELTNRFHHRREFRQCAGSQVIAVSETSGKDYRVEPFHRHVLVPDELYGFADHRFDSVITIVIAVGSWKNNNTELHAHSQTIRYSSMTGLVKTSFARRSTCSRDASFTAMLKIFPCLTSVISERPIEDRLR